MFWIVFSFFSMFVLGLMSFPFILFLRCRRDGSWDDSNITNIIRVLAHLATHPSDFAKMQFADGTRPFWYVGKDEFADVVNTRPAK